MTDLFTSTHEIKALSLWQPWASLMVAGVKLHETRHWPTEYRGPLAIHAAKMMDLAGAPEELCIAVFGRDWAQTLPCGAVLGVGQLAGCGPAAGAARRATRADLAAGNFTPNRFAWRVEDLKALDQPLPVVGRQGLFHWRPPEDLAARLRQPIDHKAQCRLIGWL